MADPEVEEVDELEAALRDNAKLKAENVRLKKGKKGSTDPEIAKLKSRDEKLKFKVSIAEREHKYKELHPKKESDWVPLIILVICIVFGLGCILYGSGSTDFGQVGTAINDAVWTVLSWVAGVGVCAYILYLMFGTVTSTKKSSGKKDDHSHH